MRILFCVQASALHAARWINQFADTGWDLHVFENVAPGHGVCPDFRCGRFHLPYPQSVPAGLERQSTLSRSWMARAAVRLRRPVGRRLLLRSHEDYLADLIGTLKPDVIHLLGLGVCWVDQSETLMRVRDRLGGKLPAPLVYSSWGTDLEVFAARGSSRESARRFLGAVGYYISECDRDFRLAQGLGFRGTYLGKLPAFGGTDVSSLTSLRSPGKPSGRRLIVLKGRDQAGQNGDRIGRAMVALDALAVCADRLRGFRVAVLQATETVAARIPVLSATTGLDIRVMSRLSYDDLMRLIGSARAVVALTVNDGLPSILVEAMALGALPVHSDLEPVREWIRDGENGLLAPPEDPRAVAQALIRSVEDDELVDRAAAENERLARERLDYADIRRRAIGMYERIVHRIPEEGDDAVHG
jgi:glycosyltransferase involved in cell wall biosynthesis